MQIVPKKENVCFFKQRITVEYFMKEENCLQESIRQKKQRRCVLEEKGNNQCDIHCPSLSPFFRSFEQRKKNSFSELVKTRKTFWVF